VASKPSNLFAVAKSIATSFTTYVPPAADFQLRNTPHSSYGLGMSLVEAVGYAVAVRTGHNPLTFAMLGNAFLFAAVALAIWAWARAAGANEILAAAVALTVSFGTMLLAYTSTGLSEIGTALGVAIALIGVELAGRRPQVGSLIAGAGVGVAVLWRPDSALLIAPLVGIAILLRARRGVPAFVLATLPVAILTVVYNWGYGAKYGGYTADQLFTHPMLPGIYGLLLSPGRGLVWYVPLFVPALVAVPWAWRRSPVLTGLCLALLFVRLPLYAMENAWMGGWSWGPRYLTPAMPCLAPLVYEVLRRVPWRTLSWRSLPVAAAVGVVIAVSVSVQVLGAAVRYDTDTANQTMTAVWRNTDVGPQDAVMFDWKYFPILEHLRELHHGRNLAAGYRGWVGLPPN